MITGNPRFFAGTEGDLFVLEFVPEVPKSGTILFFPPFGEEMNRARHMVSRQAKTMATNGYRVIIPDFYGTGDSAGEFLDARWRIWKSDTDLLVHEYNLGEDNPVWYWGLRLGALMAMDFATQRQVQPVGIVVWSPVLAGKQFINHLLRMRTMANMLADSGVTETIAGLRESLLSEDSLEIGGYELAPELVQEIDTLTFKELSQSLDEPVPVEWFEMIAAPGLQPSPAAARIAEEAAREGGLVHLHSVVGPDFWSTAEVVVAENLIDRTMDILR